MNVRRKLNWAAVILAACLLSGCDYARMKDDEAVDLYETEFPEMPEGSVPLDGEWNLPVADAGRIENPLTASPGAVAAGKQAYAYFCRQCHGAQADGRGTVGQSFAPLPTDLKTEYVQQQSDGELFDRIGRGYKRHPPLAYTISVEDRWKILLFIRSMAQEKQG